MRRYSLDVSPEHFDLTRRQLSELTTQLDHVALIAGRGPAEVATGWRGHAATQVCTEMAGLARVAGRFTDVLAGGLRAVIAFQSVTRQSQDEVAVLNARAGDPAFQDELAMLDRAFADVRERMSEGARAMRSALAGAVVAPVAPGAADALRGGYESAAVLAGMRQTALGVLGPDLALVAARHTQGWDLFASKEDAQRAADRLAGSLQGAVAAGGPLPADDVAELIRYRKNPWFATALVSRLGPAGLTDLACQVAATGQAMADVEPLSTPDYAAAQERARRYSADGERLLTGVGDALAVASHHPDQLPAGFADALVQRAATVPGAAFGLSALLHLGGQVDPRFAGTVAEGIYAAERANPRGQRMWDDLSDTGNDRPDVDPIGHDGYELAGHPGWADPLTGVSAMLGRDPAAAQGFLLAPDAGRPEQNRLHYLTGRDWAAADGGQAYGSLIEGASTKLRDHDGEGSPGHRSAQIAAQYLQELDTTDMPEQLKPATGHVLAAYINDVQRSQTKERDSLGVFGDDEPLLPGRQAYGVAMSWDDSDRFLRTIMGDGEAFRSVTAAGQVLAQQQLNYTAHRLAHPPQGVDRAVLENEWMAAVSQNALFAGATMDAANLAHIAEGQAADSRSLALQRIAASASASIPIPGGRGVEFLFSQAKDYIFRHESPHHEADERASVTNKLTVINSVRDMAATSAAANGLFDEGAARYDDRPYEPKDSPRYFLRPDGSVIPYSLMTEPQQRGYDEWMRLRMGEEQTQIGLEVQQGIKDYEK